MKNKNNFNDSNAENTNQTKNQATNQPMDTNKTETEKIVLTKEQKKQEKAILKAAKKKSKQEKRKKIEPDEFVKAIKINKNRYLATYITLLSIACFVLLFMVVTMMVLIPVWWVQLIDLAVLGFCIWRCVHLCLRVNKQDIYTLYGNCLVVQSIMVDTIIPLKDVYSATPYENLADKLRKNGAHCIRLNLSQHHKDYVVIGFIEEDLQQICNLIMKNAEQCRENQKVLTEQALKALQEELDKVRNSN